MYTDPYKHSNSRIGFSRNSVDASADQYKERPNFDGGVRDRQNTTFHRYTVNKIQAKRRLSNRWFPSEAVYHCRSAVVPFLSPILFLEASLQNGTIRTIS